MCVRTYNYSTCYSQCHKHHLGHDQNLVWIDATPELKLLRIIKYTDANGKEHKYYFIQEIQNECRKLGSILGIDSGTLVAFNKKSDTTEDFCEAVLSEWMKRGEGGQKVTWGGLLQALEDAQLGGDPYHNLKTALTWHFKN